jgi:hypothetical protein
MESASVGRPDDLEAIQVLAIGSLTERLFEAVGLALGQIDADHGRARYLGPAGVTPLLHEPDSISGLV